MLVHFGLQRWCGPTASLKRRANLRLPVWDELKIKFWKSLVFHSVDMTRPLTSTVVTHTSKFSPRNPFWTLPSESPKYHLCLFNRNVPWHDAVNTESFPQNPQTDVPVIALYTHAAKLKSPQDVIGEVRPCNTDRSTGSCWKIRNDSCPASAILNSDDYVASMETKHGSLNHNPNPIVTMETKCSTH